MNKTTVIRSVLSELSTLVPALILIVLVASSRLLPHPPNFTPIGALGLFAGAYILHRWAWLIPLLALLISDLIIGFYHPLIMLFVYMSFALSTLLGRVALARTYTLLQLGGTAIVTSLLFFILSNFAVWLTGLYYPTNFAGLVTCFINALPFYTYTLAGDCFYIAVLFGGYAIIRSWFNKTQLIS